MKLVVLFGAVAITAALLLGATGAVASLYPWALHAVPRPGPQARMVALWVSEGSALMTTFLAVWLAVAAERRARR